MYCKYCGTEISENTTFCQNCGKNQQDEMFTEKKLGGLESLLKDGVYLVKKFFSKESESVIKESTNYSCKIGVGFMLINAIVFGLVSSITITRLLNHIISGAVGILISVLAQLGIDELPFGSSSLAQVSTLYKLCFPLSALLLLVFCLEVLSIYLLLKFVKKETIQWKHIINPIAISGIPVFVGTISGLLLGFIYPPLVLCVFIVSLIIHMLLVYSVFQEMITEKTNSFFLFCIGILGLFLIISILICVVIHGGMNTLVENIVEYIQSSATNLFSSLLRNLF